MRGGFSRCEEDEVERGPGQEEKQIPVGTTYLFIHQLPFDTTDAELQEFLAGIGISLPLENICVKPQHTRLCNAIVGIPPRTIAMLCNWAINDTKFRGKSLVELKPRKQDA
jgi:hypothetical protein